MADPQAFPSGGHALVPAVCTDLRSAASELALRLLTGFHHSLDSQGPLGKASFLLESNSVLTKGKVAFFVLPTPQVGGVEFYFLKCTGA